MRYRKKPVVVEAIRWTGGNAAEMSEFLVDWPTWVIERQSLLIETLEGTMSAEPGDYVVRGVRGEFYPVKPDIFEETYEAEDEGARAWSCGTCGTSVALGGLDGRVTCERGHPVVVHSGMSITVTWT